MALAQHTPVIVDLKVAIDASSNINVFATSAPSITDYIDAEVRLPVNALYDGRVPSARKALIELWEPTTDEDNIYVKLASTNSTLTGGPDLTGNNSYQAVSKVLAKGLQRLLSGPFNCINTAPFSSYSGNVAYTTQRDYARVALATLAHHMFGHVDATAAITNDVAFVRSMISLPDDASGNAAAVNEDASNNGIDARYAAWSKKAMVDASDVEQWNVAGSNSDANLAVRLVNAIVSKGLDASGNLSITTVADASDNHLSNIVKQVVGQDPSRLMNEDNSERTKDQHQPLRFYEGDVIFVNILLKKPVVTVGPGASRVQSLGDSVSNSYAEKNFTIKITLGAAVDFA